jgi:hypothetical protein
MNYLLNTRLKVNQEMEIIEEEEGIEKVEIVGVGENVQKEEEENFVVEEVDLEVIEVAEKEEKEEKMVLDLFKEIKIDMYIIYI